MKQRANVHLPRWPSTCPRSKRFSASTSPVILSMPELESPSIIVLTTVKEAEGSSIASRWPSSRPCGVISPAVEQPAWRSDGACVFSARDSAPASTRLWEKKNNAKPAPMASASAATARAKASVSGSSVVSADRPQA